MFKSVLVAAVILIIAENLVTGCLITNCPRGGKRNGKLTPNESNVKPCVSCGPGRSGQCFGANICCGPFGCLMGTPETIKCQREGFFHEREPCIAGTGNCRKNTGRCAGEGICCTQESCHTDRNCGAEDKSRAASQDSIMPLDFYNLINYQNSLEYAEN